MSWTHLLVCPPTEAMEPPQPSKNLVLLPAVQHTNLLQTLVLSSVSNIVNLKRAALDPIQVARFLAYNMRKLSNQEGFFMITLFLSLFILCLPITVVLWVTMLLLQFRRDGFSLCSWDDTSCWVHETETAVALDLSSMLWTAVWVKYTRDEMVYFWFHCVEESSSIFPPWKMASNQMQISFIIAVSVAFECGRWDAKAF